ncbi:MAG: uroporphyrinogen-III synthase [Acidimicrobiales bacterium]
MGITMRPLEGFTVGITADRRRDEQQELLVRLGARVLCGPSIHTLALTADDELRARTAAVISHRPDVVVVTTAIGLRSWLSAAASWGCDDDLIEALGTARILARGPKAAAAARQVGLTVDWQEPTERTDALLDRLCPTLTPPMTVTVVADGSDSPGARHRLADTGCRSVEIRAYRWMAPSDPRPALRLVRAAAAGRLDVITFTSAPAVTNLFALARSDGLEEQLIAGCNRPSGTMVICVGPVTAEAAQACGVTDPRYPERGRLGLMARVTVMALAENRRSLVAGESEVTVQGAAVGIGDSVVHLSDRERALLEELLASPGTLVSRQRLLRAVWGDAGNDHILDVTVARLRRRLGPAGSAVHRVSRRGLWIDACAS